MEPLQLLPMTDGQAQATAMDLELASSYHTAFQPRVAALRGRKPLAAYSRLQPILQPAPNTILRRATVMI